MSDTILVAETGRPTGSRASNRLRAEGKVPGTVYGQGMAPVAVSVVRRDLRHALTGPAGLNAVLTLSIDGVNRPAVVKSMQRHPIKRVATHVDFLVVNLDEEITAEVAIIVEGEAKAVTDLGAMVDHQLTSLTVSARPRDIPTHFTVDITDMQVGDVIRVEDLEMPAGVTTAVDPDAAIVVAVATRAVTAAFAADAAAEADAEAGSADEA